VRRKDERKHGSRSQQGPVAEPRKERVVQGGGAQRSLARLTSLRLSMGDGLMDG
jgi:hypothetical protein